MGNAAPARRPSRIPEILLGAILIVLTTFVPYLNLVNVLPFAGLFLSGAVATWAYIIRHQVPLSHREAFSLGARTGIAGSAGVLAVVYVMLERVRELSLEGFQKMLSDLGGSLPPNTPELYQQILLVINAPAGIKAVSFLLSLIVLALLFGPLAGLGGRFTVWVLKRQAMRG